MNLSRPTPEFVFGLGLLIFACLGPHSVFGQGRRDTTDLDTTRYQNTNPFRPSFRDYDRYGDPFSTPPTSSPFFLRNPSLFKTDVEIDTARNYSIYESIGTIPYRSMSSMSFEEYVRQEERNMLKGYWQGRSKALDGESAVSSRNLIPKIYISPVLDRIFGGSYVEIIPRGFVTLDFGASFQNIENPQVVARQQRNGGFEFDQQISLNVVGKIGEKLAVTTNFDNNNSFDFQNNMKVEYTGFKEDILKKLELGNVSLPLNNSLITGAQNLFGVKAQMQFGKLFVTTIATTQRGKQNSIEIQGSTSGTSQGRPFEIVGSNYDDNRHFFLAHFFRDQFETWLSALPQPTSGVNVTRVEVYLVNRTVDTQTLRNIVGFMDMGESDKIYRTDLLTSNVSTNVPPYPPAGNENNDLFSSYLDNIDRRADTISYVLEKNLGFKAGTDFEKITSARKLANTEFTFHKELGYITLQRKLQNDEALAVAFEYTYNGRVYKVGELSEDYSNLRDEDVIYLKLLRPRKINLKDAAGKIIPTWDLMMKNIYNLNVQQLSRDNFQLRIIYRDDRTGIDNPQLQEGEITRTKQLVEVLGLDQLNPYNDPQPDGNFDFVEKITVNTESGLIIFPYLEPFNTALRNQFAQENPSTRDYLINKYVYDTLYHTTKAEAELVATKNKFWIVGSFKAGSGKEIIIQGFGISPGSVKVYAGGTPLVEGTDYTVDYTFGKVTMMNEGVLSSGKNISITYEQQDPFAFQTRSLLGTRFDYKLSDDINIGSTVLYYNERPLISRNLIGTEPARNFQYGVDLNLRKNSRVLTKIVDALPFIQTKEVSNINLNAEFAQLLPGTSNIVNGEGTSFIDDFENTATPNTLLEPLQWRIAATPGTEDGRFDVTNGAINDVRSGYKRAKLSWYKIDNSVFYVNTNRYRPQNIDDEDLKNHYVRKIMPQEIFPYRDQTLGNFNEQTLDLAYYPSERGPYNYNPDLNSNGTLKNPTTNWGGVTSAIRTEVDFDKSNIEYIEFWMMDPFINSKYGVIDDGNLEAVPNTTGGQMIFHLGSISEDLMRDGKHAFENGLPEDGNYQSGDVIKNEWGYVTTRQYLNNAFANDPSTRPNQDVGLDGASNATETTLHSALVSQVPSIASDPSADDFMHFLDPDYDAIDATVLQRYKKYGGTENNSPVNSGSVIPESSTTYPDNEDLNQDNTLSDLEEYYEYSIDLKPGNIEVGKEYVFDKIESEQFGDVVTWYLFRIPVRQFESKVGEINDFKSIRYIRMYLTGWAQPVVLRLANFRTVGNRWRRYTGTLAESQFGEPLEPNLDNFSVSVVNVEENGQGNTEKPGYVPPLARDRDITSAVQRRLNEQAVQLCVTELPDADARAIYKNVTMDFFNYGRIKMFMSAFGNNIADGELTAFLRLGTDFEENYYEIELPLTVTLPGTSTLEGVWPEQNQIDLDLNELYALKATRDRENYPLGELYPRGSPRFVGKHGIRIMGRPDLSQVKLMMIGVRNPRSPDGKSKNVCLWANELRLTDFDRTAGWAGNMVLSAKLADLGTITGSLRHITFGYGGVQSKIYERSRGETTSYDVSTNINVDKLLPQKLGLKIPVFASYESKIINPKYDPANPDMRIDATLLSLPESERDTYLGLIQDKSVRRSLNFTNVRRVKTDKEAKPHIWDIENFAFTYAYSDASQTNFSLQENTRRNIKGGAVWQYTSTFKGFEPFSKSEKLKSPYLQLIKDFNFNPMPSSITVRAELDRSFSKIIYRNSIEDQQTGIPNFQKFFIFNRFYNARWALTKALTFEYGARVNAIIDEPDGDIDTEDEKEIVKDNLKKFGRMKNFEQTATFNYTVPLDKIPMVNWIGAEYRYNVGYSWRAGPLPRGRTLAADSLQLGNIIQNNRDQTLNGRLDLVKLYNKWGWLKDINTPKRPLTPLERAKQAKTQPDTVPKPPELKAVKGFMRLLMSVRNINGTYSLTEGTILPGYLPSPYLFGMDKTWTDPGWKFVVGGQDPSIRYRQAERGNITTSSKLTTAFSQSRQQDITARANVEPTSDLKITLDLKKNVMSGYQEIYRYTDLDDGTNVVPNYESLSPSRTGAYRVSMITISTAFDNNTSVNSTVFKQFEDNIGRLKDRFNATGQIANYEDQSQDVLIPAFLAAYTGTSADVIPLTPFPQIPLPNWRLDYNGLSKLGNLKDIFQAVTLSHSYSSSYSVTNFTNSLQYTDVGLDVPLNSYNTGNNFATSTNDDGQVVPIYVISQVMISETFAPLIGINVRTKNKMTARFEYKTKRDLSLNISNAQITELNNRDWAFELGYTKNNMRLPFRDQGRVITLKNDITFKVNVSVNNSLTIQRKIDDQNIITNGNLNLQIRPNVSYVINQKLNVQVYFDRNVNEPHVSNSFPRTTTRFGTKIMYNLAQ